MSLLDKLNERFLALHTAKEDAFWKQKMDHSGYRPGSFEKLETALQQFSTDSSHLAGIRREHEKANLPEEEKTGLAGWERFFQVNAIENEKARKVHETLVVMEGELQEKRRTMKLQYLDPSTGEMTEVPIEHLRLLISTSPEESTRKNAWESMRSVETYLLSHGFIELVKRRNEFARLLGFSDFYDYRVNQLEGISKKQLFQFLDALERETRDSTERTLDRLAQISGEGVKRPWNVAYAISGALTKEMDPYLQFEAALHRWGQTFHGMGIDYAGAELRLDLVSRKGKYENGFMHGPIPTLVRNGKHTPARIHFTANAVPRAVGAGKVALETLFHEGGHAAHFANIRMPSPCFSQEFPPTSMAFAETQSMFMDNLCLDADWLHRYALSSTGEHVPESLLQASIERRYRFMGFFLRSLMAVAYAEVAIYELPDSQLNAKNIINVIREAERKLFLLEGSPRPVLSIPHLISGEAAASYQGYVLAQMAVCQTREFFRKEHGFLTDNPMVGQALRKHYWEPGNSLGFLELVKSLTGSPFSADATIREVNKSLEEQWLLSRMAIDRVAKLPRPTGQVDLQAKIYLVHGDVIIASNEKHSFHEMADRYASWYREVV